MDNLTYEVFIRRCWNCERFKHGANTDTWERLIIDILLRPVIFRTHKIYVI